MESSNKLEFLDVCVTRTSSNEVETSIYKKATNTNI